MAARVQLLEPRLLLAAPFAEFVDPNPAAGNQFGATVIVLSTGNVVVTSPGDDFGGTDAGAVYLFNGATGSLISTLRGSQSNDQIGNAGVTALSNGNFVVVSTSWDNGAVASVGAVTWGSGTTGVSSVVSAANSLVGTAGSDQIGSSGIVALSNGNYLVRSPNWNNVSAPDAGAVTWGAARPASAVSSARPIASLAAIWMTMLAILASPS
ncbi:MAG: hypothetical protein SH850_01320 [Planctomycetaceae bacterium]|nr:hypothetical protein [Planctomycetaceae bacterium]